jgi:hypothetical protein
MARELKPLLPKQKEAYRHIITQPQDTYLLLGYGGAMGGGKSFLIARTIVDLLFAFPGISILLCRKELTALKSSTMQELWKALPPGMYTKNDNEHWIAVRDRTWPQNVTSVLHYTGVQDVLKLGSSQYQAIFIDEAGELTGQEGYDIAHYLLTRLRFGLFPKEVDDMLRQQCGHVDEVKHPELCSDCPPGWCAKHDDLVVCPNICPSGVCPRHGPIRGRGMRYLFFAAANPEPGFFTDWFWKGQYGDALKALEEHGKVKVVFVQSLPRDNPHNGPFYEENLRALLPPEKVKRYVEGRFDVYAGLVYEAFNPDIHAWKDPVPKYVGVYGGIDLGFEQSDAHYTAGIVAVLTDTGRLIRVDEFQQRGVGVYRRLADWMGRMEEKWAKPIKKQIRWVGDRSQGLGISELKRAFDIVPSKGGHDSVENGVRLVSIRMLPDATGKPGSYYLPAGHAEGGCPNWAHAVSEWVRDKDTNRLVDEPDILAADRYMHERLRQGPGDPRVFLRQLPVVRAG